MVEKFLAKNNHKGTEKFKDGTTSVKFSLHCSDAIRQPELGGFHTWMKIEIAEWKIGDPIDDSVFVIPAEN